MKDAERFFYFFSSYLIHIRFLSPSCADEMTPGKTPTLATLQLIQERREFAAREKKQYKGGIGIGMSLQIAWQI